MFDLLVDMQGGQVNPGLSYVDVLKTATEVKIVLRAHCSTP